MCGPWKNLNIILWLPCFNKWSSYIKTICKMQRRRQKWKNLQIHLISFLTDCWNWTTITETVASVTHSANAHGRVIDDSTFSIGCASARARINTFLVDASHIRWAVWAEYTFWPTIGHGANHTSNTATLSLTRHNLTLWIWSAWWWRAWVGRYGS